jgi:hypothetical protein
MSRIEKDEEREERIHNEVIVDAYGEDEQEMGWFYYLTDSMNFPFQAQCIKEIRKSPLKSGEMVTVMDMVADDRGHDMLAEIEFQGRTLAVPLSQLQAIDGNELTRQAIEDWHYWVARGYEFG